MDVVAAEVGLSAPALFKRFGSKNELMTAALAPPRPDWIFLVLAGPTEEPVRTQLLRIGTEIDAFFLKTIPCMMVLKEAGLDLHVLSQPTEISPATAEGSTKEKFPVIARENLEAWFRKAGEAGLVSVPSPRAAAISLLGGIQARIFLGHVSGESSNLSAESEEHVSGIVDLMLDGLRPLGDRTNSRLDADDLVPPSSVLVSELGSELASEKATPGAQAGTPSTAPSSTEEK